MPGPHDARWHRLLSSRDEAVLLGDAAVAVSNQVLVSAHHAERVHDAVRRWVDHRVDHDDLGVAQLHLRSAARVDVAELVSEQQADGDGYRRYGIAANHLYCGERHVGGEPEGGPVPTDPITPPLLTPTTIGSSDRRVVVGMLDTGIDPHPWFVDREWFADCHREDREILDRDRPGILDRDAGHGTFIAGVVMQHAPKAWLRVERVLGSDGICDELELLRGLNLLYQRSAEAGDPIDILNLSLGCYTFDDRPSPLLTKALWRFGRRALVIAAAGNDASDRPFWPAALKSCIAVGALAADDGGDPVSHGSPRRAGFSNYGWWVDACAEGERIHSSFVYFREADGIDFEGYAMWNGTSFAAPRVAGAIAGLAIEKNMNVLEAAMTLLDPEANETVPDLGVVVQA